MSLGDVEATDGFAAFNGVLTDVGIVATEIRGVLDTVFGTPKSREVEARPAVDTGDTGGEMGEPEPAIRPGPEQWDTGAKILLGAGIVLGLLIVTRAL